MPNLETTAWQRIAAANAVNESQFTKCLLRDFARLAAEKEKVRGEAITIPLAAYVWLMGEGPDPAGFWFGDHPDDQTPKGEFWWRKNFRTMIEGSALEYDKTNRTLVRRSTITPPTVPRESKPPPDTEYSWLIEDRRRPETITWFDGTGWTSDAYSALRIHDQATAENLRWYIERVEVLDDGPQHIIPQYRVTEHGFDSVRGRGEDVPDTDDIANKLVHRWTDDGLGDNRYLSLPDHRALVERIAVALRYERARPSTSESGDERQADADLDQVTIEDCNAVIEVINERVDPVLTPRGWQIILVALRKFK